MLLRLAKAIHWLALLCAVGWGFIGYQIITDATTRHPTSSDITPWIIAVLPAAFILGTGWLFNYVVSGNTSVIPD